MGIEVVVKNEIQDPYPIPFLHSKEERTAFAGGGVASEAQPSGELLPKEPTARNLMIRRKDVSYSPSN